MKISKNDHENLMLYKSILRSFERREYAEIVAQVQVMIEAGTYNQAQLDPFLYYQAACLDLLGKAPDALPIFHEMLARQPANIAVGNSVRITAQSIHTMAAELFDKAPEAKELETYESVLLAVSLAPFWLRIHLAKRRAQAGDTVYAKSLCTHYLALNPRDGEYLKAAVEIAKILTDHVWLEILENDICALIEACPYRLDLYALLEDFQQLQYAA